MRKGEWDTESYLGITRIPTDSDEGVACVEAWAAFWIQQLELQKWPRALSWYENYHFLRGNHYPHTTFAPLATATSGTVFTDSDPAFFDGGMDAFDEYVPKVVDNLLLEPNEKNLAILTKDQLEPSIRPNSDDAFDEFAARFGEKVFEAYFEELGGHELRMELAGLNICVGTNAFETYYGPTSQVIAVPKLGPGENELTGEMMENFRPTDEIEYVHRDDLQVAVWSGFHLDPDPCAKLHPATHTWFHRCSYEDIDEIRETFDVDAEGFFPENLEALTTTAGPESPLYWYEQMQHVLDAPGIMSFDGRRTTGSSQYGNTASPNQTMLHVFDCRPGRHFHSGRTLIFAGTSLIYAGPARAWSENHPERWHGYSFSRYFTRPGSWWGMPLLSALVPLQKRVNAIDMIIRINREHIALGSYLIPRTARVKKGDISGLPGQHIWYTPSIANAKPEPLKHDALPPELVVERDMLERRIRDLGGTKDHLQGKAPSGIRATGMLEFLDRKDLEGKLPMVSSWDNTLQSLGKNMLIEVDLHIDDMSSELYQRVRQALRQDGEIAIDAFQQASLRDNVNISFGIQSALMRRPEAERESAVNYAQFVGSTEHLSPHERSVIARKLQMDEIDQERSPSYRRIRTMISLILAGITDAAIPLPGVDDPAICADVCRVTILEPSFNERAEEVQNTVWMLLKFYQTELQKQAEQQLLAQARQVAIMSQAENAGSEPAGGGGGGQRQLRSIAGGKDRGE
jgi:hypothetical protein